MTSAGYDSLFKQRTSRAAVHRVGVVIAWKRDVFDLFRSGEMELNRCTREEKIYAPLALLLQLTVRTLHKLTCASTLPTYYCLTLNTVKTCSRIYSSLTPVRRLTPLFLDAVHFSDWENTRRTGRWQEKLQQATMSLLWPCFNPGKTPTTLRVPVSCAPSSTKRRATMATRFARYRRKVSPGLSKPSTRISPFR